MDEDEIMTDATAASSTASAFDSFNTKKSKGKSTETKDFQAASNAASDATLPWVEKYRPVTLDDLVSHKDITSTIERFIDENRLPHMLLYGPPGTGKTSTILACARKLYGPMWKSMTMELNASDDRGIDVVREQIKNFASTRKIFSSGFKLIILDEADMMTQTAQNALRRVVEKYTRNVRFCIICNYVSKIIPALQSRCTRFRFGPLETSQVELRLEHIIQAENVNITPEGRNALLSLSKGDMRRALNILQACHAGYEIVDQDAIYNCTGQPHPNDIHAVMTSLFNDDFTKAYSTISLLKTMKGMALQDILTEVYNSMEIYEDLPDNAKVYILDKIADVEYKLSTGSSEKMQLTSLIGSFKIAVEMMAK
ncbi:Subunit of heteropentameric Replication factor C (RF-C) [Podila clonocystis]|nr:Subunit of heteropentameric Replication factor C (RF-C) [Podila clonocystis]